jgi:CRISPR-associated protein Csh1
MFLNALYEIGEYHKNNIIDKGGLPLLTLQGVQYLKETGTYQKVVLMDINSTSNTVNFSIEELEANADHSLQYLYKYRNGSQAGNEFSFTNKVNIQKEKAKIDWNKFFNYYKADKNSWSTWLEVCKDETFYNTTKNILNTIIQNFENIESYIETLFTNDDTFKKGCIFTVKYDGKYLNEIKECVDCFDFCVQKHNKSENTEPNVCCSFCGSNQNVKYGIPEAFKFATIDKEGFATDFNVDTNRDYPVCIDCRTILTSGRQFIEDNLSYNFNGLKYKVVPHSVFKSTELLDEMIYNLKETKNPNLYQNHKNFMSDPEGIIELASELNNSVLLNLVFLSQKGVGGDQIDLLMQDVLPTRLSIVIKAKRDLDDVYSYETKDVETKYRFFTMGTIFNFYQHKKSKNVPFDKSFFEVVESIFKGGRINKHLIVSKFMDKIREDIFEPDKKNPHNYPKDSIRIMQFLSKLDIVDFKYKGEPMKDNIFKEYFEQIGIVDSSYLAGVMLIGALVTKVRIVQKENLDNDPFKKNLKGYNLNRDEIIVLANKVKSKLEEYNAFKGSENIIWGTAFKLMMDETPVSNGIANWYLIGGMSLEYEIMGIAIDYLKSQKPNSQDEEQENNQSN